MKKLLQLLLLTTAIAIVVIFTTTTKLDSLPGILRHQATTKLVAAAPTLQHFWESQKTNSVWSNTGGVMMSLAAQVTASRNAAGQSLTASQKKYLRTDFGDLVDRVQINYNAKLLDRWSNGEKEVHVGAVDAAAQAFCDRIYVRASYRPRDTAQLVLLAHELTHFQQCIQLGGLSQFGANYFAAYQQAHQSYEHNQFEQAARDREQQFIQHLCQHIDCQQPSGRYYVNYRGVAVKLPIQLN
jgi:Domain of unknown function (DUF4157)